MSVHLSLKYSLFGYEFLIITVNINTVLGECVYVFRKLLVMQYVRVL